MIGVCCVVGGRWRLRAARCIFWSCRKLVFRRLVEEIINNTGAILCNWRKYLCWR